MELITPLLHGLAYVGVYVLNLLIYETIAILVWLIAAGIINRSSISEQVGDEILRKIGLVLLIAFIGMCILFLFGIGCIVQYPTSG